MSTASAYGIEILKAATSHTSRALGAVTGYDFPIASGCSIGARLSYLVGTEGFTKKAYIGDF